MARVNKLPQFGKYSADMVMYEIDRAGTGYCVESQYSGCGYVLKGNSIVMLGGKNGVLAIDKDRFLDFVDEMLGVYELAEARDRAGIKRNYQIKEEIS